MMFSVALNEAIEFRRTGMLCEVLPGSQRDSGSGVATFRQLGSAPPWARWSTQNTYGTIPNAAPLDPSNFQGPQEQRTARMSDLLSRVLFTQRSQFLHKIGTLEEMVGDFGKDFRLTVENLAAGASDKPGGRLASRGLRPL